MGSRRWGFTQPTGKGSYFGRRIHRVGATHRDSRGFRRWVAPTLLGKALTTVHGPRTRRRDMVIERRVGLGKVAAIVDAARFATLRGGADHQPGHDEHV